MREEKFTTSESKPFNFYTLANLAFKLNTVKLIIILI